MPERTPGQPPEHPRMPQLPTGTSTSGGQTSIERRGQTHNLVPLSHLHAGQAVNFYPSPVTDGMQEARCPACRHWISNIPRRALSHNPNQPLADWPAITCGCTQGPASFCPCRLSFQVNTIGAPNSGRYVIARAWEIQASPQAEPEPQPEPVEAAEPAPVVRRPVAPRKPPTRTSAAKPVVKPAVKHIARPAQRGKSGK